MLIIYLIIIALLLISVFIFFYGRIKKIITSIINKRIYKKYSIGSYVLSDYEKKLIIKNRNILSENRVSINKIRFVFTPIFQYDIETDIINPRYDVMIPMLGGYVDKKSPIISVNKPHHLLSIITKFWQNNDNFANLKRILKHCKKGVVIMIANKECYEYNVDEYIQMAILDDEIEKYNQNNENYGN